MARKSRKSQCFRSILLQPHTKTKPKSRMDHRILLQEVLQIMNNILDEMTLVPKKNGVPLHPSSNQHVSNMLNKQNF